MENNIIQGRKRVLTDNEILQAYILASKGVSIGDIADHFSITRQTLSNYFRKERRIADEFIMKNSNKRVIEPSIPYIGKLIGDEKRPKNEHLLFVGNNANSLLLLNDEKNKFCYKEKVDLIYIDPAYNSKNPYHKSFSDKNQNWNSEVEWQLCQAKDLLKDSGIIFISIGEEKIADLLNICNGIFDSKNKLALFTVETPNQTESFNLIKNSEFLLAYGKTSKAHFYFSSKPQEARCTTAKKNQTIYTLVIPKGIRADMDDGVYDSAKCIGSNEDMQIVKGPAIIHNGILQNEIQLKGRWSCPNDVRKWVSNYKAGSPEKVYNKYKKELKELYLKGERFQPWLIKEGFDKPHSIISGFVSKGKSELKSIIGDNDFSYPKHSDFIKYIINLGTENKNAIILDFYAGSGTTGQAVIELNKEKDLNMKFILCTNNENNNINEITIPRLSTIVNGKRMDGSKFSETIDEKIQIIKVK